MTIFTSHGRKFVLYYNINYYIIYVLFDRAGRAFLDSRSCVPGVLGTRARGNAIFLKHAGTQNAKK